MTKLVVVGAVAGLAWAAGLRGWMVQMAAGEGSAFRPAQSSPSVSSASDSESPSMTTTA